MSSEVEDGDWVGVRGNNMELDFSDFSLFDTLAILYKSEYIREPSLSPKSQL